MPHGIAQTCVATPTSWYQKHTSSGVAASQAEDPFAAGSGMAVQAAPLADTPPLAGPRAGVLHGGDTGGITAAVPILAALVDEDEADASIGAVPHAPSCMCRPAALNSRSLIRD